VPHPDYTDWSTTTIDVPINSLPVLSYRGTDLIDARTTDAHGRLSMQVPAALQVGDRIILFAAASDDGERPTGY